MITHVVVGQGTQKRAMTFKRIAHIMACWGCGVEELMEGRNDSSSTQYGTACTMSGKRVAVPWMNLLNLCTCRNLKSVISLFKKDSQRLVARASGATWRTFYTKVRAWRFVTVGLQKRKLRVYCSKTATENHRTCTEHLTRKSLHKAARGLWDVVFSQSHYHGKSSSMRSLASLSQTCSMHSQRCR